jgi:hypothetical protein
MGAGIQGRDSGLRVVAGGENDAMGLGEFDAHLLDSFDSAARDSKVQKHYPRAMDGGDLQRFG